MGLKIFFICLLSALVIAQTPRMRMIKYVGTGVDNERIVDTQIGQQITLACVAVYSHQAANLVHPDFWYTRIKECDNFIGTHASGATKDSICFFNAAGPGGGESGITPKGIKRWDGDNVIVGKYLNLLDTTYVLWAVSDPGDSFLVTGIYTGDGTEPRTISTGAADSLYGLMVLPGTQNASQAHYAMWAKGSTATQYFGERQADIDNVTNNSFDVHEHIVAKMNTTNEWYGWFGVMKDAKFVQTFKYTGDAAANSADTLLFDRDGYKPFLLFGLAFLGISVTAGISGSAAFGEASDTTWRHTSTAGADLDFGSGNSSIRKVKKDSLILNNSDDLDLAGLEIKLFMMGDTAFYTPTAAGSERRQPCEGNIEILNKENIIKQDRYK